MAGTTLIVYGTEQSPNVADASMQAESQLKLISTIGILTVARDTLITAHYMLQEGLTAEIKVEDDKYVVVDYHLDEYGIGDSLKEAQEDLFDSLVDYLTSLEKRENRLGNRDLNNLQVLKRILKRI